MHLHTDLSASNTHLFLFFLAHSLEHLKDLEKLEKEKNIRPTPEIDAFMKVNLLFLLNSLNQNPFTIYSFIKFTLLVKLDQQVASVKGENNNLATEYTLKVLGIDVCADTLVGSDMFRGVSGGQKKRVTTG